MFEVELGRPPVPPFRVENGFGPICVVDADNRVVYDDCTQEEAERKVADLMSRED